MQRKQIREMPINFSSFSSGIGPQYGKRATMIFASGDQTFFSIDESMLTGAMLTKINVVADKSTICKSNILFHFVWEIFLVLLFNFSAFAANSNVVQLLVD